MWELFGIPCIHAVAAYAHLGRNPEEGVHEWYSQKGGLKLINSP